MKVKSLLLAAAAFVALGAAAQATVTTPDLVITDENVNTVIAMPLTLTMPEGGNYTNLQVAIKFPKGVKPAKDPEFDVFFDNGADNARDKKGIPYIAYSDNAFPEALDGEYNEAAWPEFLVVGANMKKIASTTNPNEFAVMYVTADETVVDGVFGIYLKATQSDDTAYEVGASPEQDVFEYVTLCNVKNERENPGDAVEDVNAAKTVASVKYMNAAGMVSDTAFQGVNIVVTKYADGTQSTAKVVK